MKLPQEYLNKTEWTLVGPMGPSVPQQLLKYPLLAIDGGARYLEKMDLWVGDGDSYQEKLTNCAHIYKYPPEKDQSDLALALSAFSLKLSYKLHLWGLLGGRKDHELFNLGEALYFLESHPGAEIVFYDLQGRVSFQLFSQGKWSFDHQGPFSLGSLKEIEIEMHGECSYPIVPSRMLKPLSSLGLSNNGYGKIYLLMGGPGFIYFPGGRIES